MFSTSCTYSSKNTSGISIFVALLCETKALFEWSQICSLEHRTNANKKRGCKKEERQKGSIEKEKKEASLCVTEIAVDQTSSVSGLVPAPRFVLFANCTRFLWHCSARLANFTHSSGIARVRPCLLNARAPYASSKLRNWGRTWRLVLPSFYTFCARRTCFINKMHILRSTLRHGELSLIQFPGNLAAFFKTRFKRRIQAGIATVGI